MLNYTPWPYSRHANQVFCRGFYHLVLPHLVRQAQFADSAQTYFLGNSLWAAGMSESVASMAAQLRAVSERVQRPSPRVEDPSAADRLAMIQGEIRRLSRQIEQLSIRIELIEEGLRESGTGSWQ